MRAFASSPVRRPSYAGEVRSLLAKGADPNIPDRAGRTALHGAARLGAVETMSALLDAGGNPNQRDEDGNTPLHFASDASQAPLMVHHSIATIRVLLSARANPNLTNAAGRTPLHLAAGSHDEPGGVAALLSSGADPNRKDGRGDTALHAAVGSGWPAVVGALLDGGADPRITNADGLTALQLFVWDGPDQGRTAAMLVEAGADPDRKYANGDAPLHAAIRRGGSRGKVEVAEALLATGADPCIRDGRGFIPYSVAAEGGAIHRALDRAGGHDLGCDGQGEAVALDSGERRRVQEALARAGFDPGPADGKFGPRTRRAIEGWQQANGHSATGKLTRVEVETMLASPEGEPQTRTVKEAQRLLAALGYKPGPADGLWGPQTAGAYAAFLRDSELSQEMTLGEGAMRTMRKIVEEKKTSRSVSKTKGAGYQPQLIPDAATRNRVADRIGRCNELSSLRLSKYLYVYGGLVEKREQKRFLKIPYKSF